MRSRSDPLRRVQRQQRRRGPWARSWSPHVDGSHWGPLSTAEVGFGAKMARDAPAVTPPAPDLFDAKAFDVALWNPTESRKLASGFATGAASRPATRVQLVGITEEKGVLRAALYDPDSDRLWIVGNGESIPGQRVQSLTASGDHARRKRGHDPPRTSEQTSRDRERRSPRCVPARACFIGPLLDASKVAGSRRAREEALSYLFEAQLPEPLKPSMRSTTTLREWADARVRDPARKCFETKSRPLS